MFVDQQLYLSQSTHKIMGTLGCNAYPYDLVKDLKNEYYISVVWIDYKNKNVSFCGLFSKRKKITGNKISIIFSLLIQQSKAID